MTLSGRGTVPGWRNDEPRSSETMMGININDRSADYTGMIIDGRKTVETRRTRSLDSVIGQRVGIIRTGRGPATLVATAVIGAPVWYATGGGFRADWLRHRVAAGSEHDAPEGCKWGYPLRDIEPVTPRVITSRGIVLRRID